MNITFHGAAQSVTGSCFLVQAHGCGFLIDCSMAQGGREADEHNQQAFAFDAADLDEVLLKDSARLQMMDAERAARREHQPAVPLYSPAHVASTLEQVQARPYGHSFEPVAARG